MKDTNLKNKVYFMADNFLYALWKKEEAGDKIDIHKEKTAFAEAVVDELRIEIKEAEFKNKFLDAGDMKEMTEWLIRSGFRIYWKAMGPRLLVAYHPFGGRLEDPFDLANSINGDFVEYWATAPFPEEWRERLEKLEEDAYVFWWLFD